MAVAIAAVAVVAAAVAAGKASRPSTREGPRKRAFSFAEGVSLLACTRSPESFDSDQIRAAERRVTAALVAPDATAWVDEYTDDAVRGRSMPEKLDRHPEHVPVEVTGRPIVSGEVHVGGVADGIKAP